jgi:P27 family predicted phage terminase small subunit
MCGADMADNTSKRPQKAPAPAHLDKAGKALWKEIHQELPDGWVLDHREIAILRLACEQADDLSSIRDTMKAQGNVVEGSRGQQVMNPLLTEARQARTSISRLLGQLALPDADAQPMTMRQAQGREAAKKKKVQTEAWKARQQQARERRDGKT